MLHILDHPQRTYPLRSSDTQMSILCIFHSVLLRNWQEHRYLFFLGMGSYIGCIHRSCIWHIRRCSKLNLMLSWMDRRMICICHTDIRILVFFKHSLQHQSKYSCRMSKHCISHHLLWMRKLDKLGCSSHKGLAQHDSLPCMICIFWFDSYNQRKNLRNIFQMIVGMVWNILNILVLLLFSILELHKLLRLAWMVPHIWHIFHQCYSLSIQQYFYSIFHPGQQNIHWRSWCIYQQ